MCLVIHVRKIQPLGTSYVSLATCQARLVLWRQLRGSQHVEDSLRNRCDPCVLLPIDLFPGTSSDQATCVPPMARWRVCITGSLRLHSYATDSCCAVSRSISICRSCNLPVDMLPETPLLAGVLCHAATETVADTYHYST